MAESRTEARVEGLKIRTHVPDFSSAKNDLIQSFRRHMRSAHHKAMRETELALKDAIKETKAIATGKLLTSVTSRFLEGKHASSDTFTTRVGFKQEAEEYAYFANYGRSAGNQPPVEPILQWLRAKIARGLVRYPNAKANLTSAYAIAEKIGARGTTGHFFMEKAEERLRGVREKILESAAQDFYKDNK